MEKRKPGRPKKEEAAPVIASTEEVKAFEPLPIEYMSQYNKGDGQTKEEASPELTENAYSITRDPKTQKWQVISIPYDNATKTVGKIQVIEANTDRKIVIERYQVLSGNEFFSS